MAKPMEYFRLDCNLGDKFRKIEAEFGLVGFAIIIKLFQRIYGEKGYYCEWDDEVALLFAKDNGVGCSVVKETVSAAIRRRIFDGEMFEKYGILTSCGIQERFSDMAKRRSVIFDKPEYVIVSCAQISENVCNSAENVCNSAENVCNSQQSTVEYSKAEDSTGEDKAAASPPASAITKDSLVKKYGYKNVSYYEEKFDKWKSKKGNTIHVDKYSTIAKWMEQDGVTKRYENSSFDVDEVMKEIHDSYIMGR